MLLALLLALLPALAQAQSLTWPSNQLLPTFPAPAAVLDCIDVSSTTTAETDLFASLEGIVNRTQPRVVCVANADSEGKFTWLNLHNLPYTLVSGYSAITKYRTNFAGLVVTDPAQPDTLNLATTIAGVSNLLICDPSLLATLTNVPYSLPVVQDLRGRFSNRYQIYGYLYTNYWPQCTHRMITGLYTNLHGELRDYAVAVKSATVWLDPGPLNFSDQSTLALFLKDMTPLNGIYMGWWPDEGNGLNWIAQYGIPVLASDYFRNGSVYSGIPRSINVPDIPPPPPLTNKVYVALVLSDGDNIQYMQHVMKMDWDKTVRGSVPIGWTVSPLAADLDPVLLNHYWNTATTNDCLISGPSGAGYSHIEKWGSANLAGLTRLSDGYLQRAGVRVITVWDQVTTGVAQSFATNCPTLFGLTDQSGGSYTSVNLGLRTIGMTVTYSSSVADIISGLTNAAKNWTGTSPLFLAAQANVWSLGPSDLKTIANALDPAKYQVVRPDHLFMLANQLFGAPMAVTKSATRIFPNSATLQGFVLANAPSAAAWFEWGTNISYPAKTGLSTATGTRLTSLSSTLSGLVPGVTYHYRVAISNSLGVVRGADRIFNTAAHVKAWGDSSAGQTRLPPGLTNAVSVAAGAYHALALENDGSVLAWGSNTYNQTNVPPGLSSVVQVAGGVQHSAVLNASGTVSAWGDNSLGQTNVPGGLNNVVEIAAGGYHNLALRSDGTVTAWGSNSQGQTNVPPNLTNAVAVAAGRFHSLALRADGTVAAWGSNTSGLTNVPAGLGQVVAIAAGDYHNLALKAEALDSADLLPACRWSADTLPAAEGASVGTWMDVARGKVATQGSTANQPTFHTHALNGHAVLRFASASSQYLTVASDNPMSGAGNFTLVTVFRTTTPGLASSSFYQNTGLLGCEQPNVVADWALCLNGAQLGAGLGAGGGGCATDMSLYGGNVTDGRAHIAIYQRSGGTIRLYVDGAIAAEQAGVCLTARGTYSFLIGAMTTGSGYFDGDLAEVQVYDRALSAAELTTLNSTLAATYGMSGVAGAPRARWLADTLTGSDGSAVSVWTDTLSGRPATQANLFNQPRLYSNVLNGHKTVRFASGSSQYLTVVATNSPLAAMGSFTAIVVFKTTTPGAASGVFYQNTGLLGCEQSGVVADWALCLNSTQVGAGLGGGTGGCGADLSLYGGSVTDGKPHIAMYVHSGDTVILYVDGVVVATQSALCPAARGDYAFQIGAMTPGALCFNGDMAEIQLYDRALSPWEISNANEALAAAYGVGGAAGTLVAWGNNGSGQTDVPRSTTNLTAIAAGSTFSLALNADGTVAAWGNNSYGQTSLLPGLTNVTALAGGLNFAFALGNQLPWASNAMVSGYLNHDLTFALPGGADDGNPFSFRILSLPSAGTLYQYAGGTRGTPVLAANTTVTDPAGQVVFAPADGASGNPYAMFSFQVDDGAYTSSVAQVSVNIGLPAAPEFSVLNASANGGFGLEFSGSSNATYSVWASTNLLDWTRIGPASETSPGVYDFLDTGSTNWPQRFYRAVAP